MFMKFITLQSLPTKEYYDENKKFHKEICSFKELTVPINKSLGFRPMWAVPLTTFKETMASALMIAANYPQCFCIFDTDDFVRVDKIKWYQKIKDGDTAEIPIAAKELPDYLTEYVLDIERLSMPLIMGSIEAVMDIKTYGTNIKEAISILMEKKIPPTDFTIPLRKAINSLPSIMVESKNNAKKLFEEAGFENTDVRVTLNEAWYYYKYTILPMILYSFCEDTKKPEEKVGNIAKLSFDPIMAYSCLCFFPELRRIEEQIAAWSVNDCSEPAFTKMYNGIKESIVDDPNLLESLYFGEKEIGRNDRCPCGSGKKFKKCHGKYF